MRLRSWIVTGTLFITSVGLWTGYVVSRRAFLRDYNEGVHAYLASNFIEAESRLTQALHRWPRDKDVQHLLIKTLIERSFAQFHAKDFTGALDTLTRAVRITPPGDPAQQALGELKAQLSDSSGHRPQSIEEVLQGVYQRLPEKEQPESLQTFMQKWLQKSQNNQEAVFKRFWENQERWLRQLDHQKDDFRKILYGGLAVFVLVGLTLLALLLGALHAYFGRRGVFSRLLEAHYQRLVAALPAGSQVLLGPPVSFHQGAEARQLDIIEAEIVSGRDADESHRRLERLLEEESPWLRARAAKILHQLNPRLALVELKRLVNDTPQENQISGMWALAELATPEALELLAPLAYSTVREIQQGAIRSLLQLQTKETLSSESKAKLHSILTQIRTKTGWIF